MKTLFGITPHPKVMKVSKDSPLHIESVKGWYEHNLKLAKAYRKLAGMTNKKVSINNSYWICLRHIPKMNESLLLKKSRSIGIVLLHYN